MIPGISPLSATHTALYKDDRIVNQWTDGDEGETVLTWKPSIAALRCAIVPAQNEDWKETGLKLIMKEGKINDLPLGRWIKRLIRIQPLEYCVCVCMCWEG